MSEAEKYYLGLDIGTDSVGYAVTDTEYNLKKFKGEPAWGAHLFEGASTAAERRQHRVDRRRIDRRQQRVLLLEELFAPEIYKLDPDFFKRRRESALFGDDSDFKYCLFDDKGYTDKEYNKQYPTIHHLICELMKEEKPHDVRLVFHACAWLVAHRGHFLFDVDNENVAQLLDFGRVYSDFMDFFGLELGCAAPWSSEVSADTLLSVMKMKSGVRRKLDEFKKQIYAGNKISKEPEDSFPFSREAIARLLCGATVKPQDLFCNSDYADLASMSLNMDDGALAELLTALDEDAGLVIKLRALADCALLIGTQNGRGTVSEAMVDVYNLHKADLKWLKYYIKKYQPEDYNALFRADGACNYVAYSGNAKNADKTALKKAKKEDFLKYLGSLVKGKTVEKKDEEKYNDMLARIEAGAFLPKQKSTDNRVIPQQLYRYELKEILNKASGYLPFLNDKDDTGLTVSEKVLSIFDFKIPYYVGPLKENGNHAWIKRKAQGKIYPWNFAKLVDFYASEQEFINNMTCRCSYLPDEDVLPVNSLLYCKFTVLNEINSIKINGVGITPEMKQEIYTRLFMVYPRVTLKKIKDLLISRAWMTATDEISGIDQQVKTSLKSYHYFKRLLESGALNERQVEDIIEHAAFSEDRRRMSSWLTVNYPELTAEDVKYICRLNLKEFGRLSRRLLTEVYCADEATGEAVSIIDMMWHTNENLMQLLSDKYGYRSEIEAIADDYYSEHPATLSERMKKMYVSNAVKRPIIRTLAVAEDVVKAFRCPPQKIFIEMARDASNDQKGKRTKTRKQQLLELYSLVKTEDVKQLSRQLEEMGEKADNMLQSDVLFLYYLQLGKCAYSGEAIDITRLNDGTYNKDHIYPRAYVKDDSVLNNLVLVKSVINGNKTDNFPVSSEIQTQMQGYWNYLRNIGLMTDEKYRRLTRKTGFTDEERLAFINRQLVETRQSTKVVAQLLKEQYPETEIVYVKAGLVSEFRQEFDCIKCREVNNLHHAKDAYLNVVVGNVYNERFNKNWFSLNSEYSIKAATVFSRPLTRGGSTLWRGSEDIGKVKQVLAKNSAHVTRYAFCRKGKLFNQQPEKAKLGLVPLKSGLPTEKYGGYNNTAVTFYVLAKYTNAKKSDIMFVPIELMYAERFESDSAFAEDYVKATIETITGKAVTSVELMLNGRKLKINTVLSLDGFRVCLAGKTSKGRQITITGLTPLIMSYEEECYIKTMASFLTKKKTNANIALDSQYDHISAEKNVELYDKLTDKACNSIFKNCPGNPTGTLQNGREKFIAAPLEKQIALLNSLVSWFGAASSTYDFTVCGGSANFGSKVSSSNLSAWRGKYDEVRIIDTSASGLFETAGCNLLALL